MFPGFLKVNNYIRKMYQNGDPSHDWSHVVRVLSICEVIGRKEGADLSVLRPAAILHDIINLPKNDPDHLSASSFAANEAEKVLQMLNYNDSVIAKIRKVIVEHSSSLKITPSSTEAAVLQDADKLDALGAIGILRAVTCGCRLNALYYDVDDPFSRMRKPNGQKFILDHFLFRLLEYPNRMNTPSGKAEAARRVHFMKLFLDRLNKDVFDIN